MDALKTGWSAVTMVISWLAAVPPVVVVVPPRSRCAARCSASVGSRAARGYAGSPGS